MAREMLLTDELRQSDGTHIVTNYASRSRLEIELNAKTIMIEKL